MLQLRLLQCCRSLLPSHLAIAAIPANPRGLLDARQYYNLHIYILHIGMSPYEQSSAPCRAREVRNQFVPIFRLIRFFFFVTGVLIKSHATGTGSSHAQVIRECRTNLVIARGTEGLLEAGGLVAAAVRWTTPTRLPRP